MKDEPGLLERARSYDPDALGELYDHYAPRIYAYIYRRVGDACLAEDLTGDVFVRVMQAIRSERLWHTSFRAWLYRIGHNVVVDHCRQRHRLSTVSLDEGTLPAGGCSMPDAAQGALDGEWLRGAIRRLTPEQQEVLALRFGEGLSARETAQVLRKTTGAVEALQHRGLAALRRLWEKEAASQQRQERPGVAERAPVTWHR